MAKKKDFNISADMLMGLTQQSEDENKKVRQLKEQREQESTENVANYEEQQSRVVVKSTVKKFDRKRERPIQKTVHLTIEIDNKVNMIKSVLKTLGKKTTFEDFLFDLLDDWMKKHYDEVLGGKVVYPGEE